MSILEASSGRPACENRNADGREDVLYPLGVSLWSAGKTYIGQREPVYRENVPRGAVT